MDTEVLSGPRGLLRRSIHHVELVIWQSANIVRDRGKGMVRRAFNFFGLSVLAVLIVLGRHGFSIRDESVLGPCFIAIASCLVYVHWPWPFNHLFCFLVYSVPVWIFARVIHAIATIFMAGGAIMVLLGLVAITFAIDYAAFRALSGVGCIFVTIALITAWLLFGRHLRKVIKASNDKLRQFVQSTVQPIDRSIYEAHKRCEDWADWVRGVND